MTNQDKMEEMKREAYKQEITRRAMKESPVNQELAKTKPNPKLLNIPESPVNQELAKTKTNPKFNNLKSNPKHESFQRRQRKSMENYYGD